MIKFFKRYYSLVYGRYIGYQYKYMFILFMDLYGSKYTKYLNTYLCPLYTMYILIKKFNF